MSVFISYNHKDEKFVERLCQTLIQNNVPVWRDKWQMNLGDSITSEVQNALEKASYVCLVLSKNALESKWVNREINASLVRELEENNLPILPLIIDDCKIPLFLRDKLYADFRVDFDAGVRMILNAVADKYNLFSGKISNEDITTSFGTDVVLYQNQIEINIDIISQDKNIDYFILTKIKITGNKEALMQYKLYKDDGEIKNYVNEIIGICSSLPQIRKKKVKIGGNSIAHEEFAFENKEYGLIFKVETNSKKVGNDNGKFVVFNLGILFEFYNNKEMQPSK